MDLTEENKEKLRSKGLILFGRERELATRYTVFKPKEVKGNFIRNWESIPIITGYNSRSEVIEEYVSDMPGLTIWFRDQKWEVMLHEWVPGPGPGDFREIFESQNQAVEFVVSYYFGQNKFFIEKRNDIDKRRNALKKEELRLLFQKAMESIDEAFPESEIDFQTEHYKKTPLDTWPGFLHRGGYSDYYAFKFDLGILASDAHELKKILYDGKDFSSADWARLSSVLIELSRLKKEEEN